MYLLTKADIVMPVFIILYSDVQLIKQFFINGIHVIHRLWFEVTAAITPVVTTLETAAARLYRREDSCSLLLLPNYDLNFWFKFCFSCFSCHLSDILAEL